MNILFIHEVEWLNKVVIEIHNLAESLSLMGHNVYAIAYPDRWTRKNLFDLGNLKTTVIPGVSRTIPGSSITLKHPGFIKIPGISRFSVAFTHYFEIKKTIEEQKIDAIMLYSVPTNGLQTIYLAHKFGIPVVFRSIDILHRLVKYPILRSPTRFLEKKVYANVDEILAITPNHAQYVIKMGAPPSRVKLLLLPIDTNIFHESVDCRDLRNQWGLRNEDKIIVFIGMLYHFSGLDSFLYSFPEVIRQVPDARLLIVGDGPQRQKLHQIVTELKLEGKVIMTGLQPYNTMPLYISMADVCINPFLNTEATRDIFPGKIIQYLACGKATVATPLLGITALLPQGSSAIIYADTGEKIAQEVITLLKSPEQINKLGQAGLDYVNNFHDQRQIARQLEKELLELAEKHKTGTKTGKAR